jgi:hemolysin activation/secretion protein
MLADVGADIVRGTQGVVGTGRAFCVACLWLAATLCFFSSASAQVIPPTDQPGRERYRFIEPATPRAEPVGPRVSLPGTVAPEGAENVQLKILDIRIEGATVYGPEELKLLYRDMIGHEVALSAVYDLAQRITARYGIDGYVLSRAIVPPQNLTKDGAVIRIQVIEGYVDKVVWPESLGRFRNFFSYYAARIIADRPANVRTIERYLLLAGDLPGLKFSTTLKASETNPNAATLLVEVVYKPIDAVARVDNRGSTTRGPIQHLGSLTANNLFGAHDSLNFTYAGVDPNERELTYWAAGYRSVLTAEGLAAFVNASYGYGHPGTPLLESLQYKTKSLYADAGLSYPLIRSREKNLSLSGLFFTSDSTSDMCLTCMFGFAFDVPTRDFIRGTRLKVDADVADGWRGINQFNVTVSQGINGLGSSPNGNPFASRPTGRVDFTKVEATASRTQSVYGPFSMYFSGYGQYSAASLLSPEQCSFGGRFYGRAFDPSQMLADSCYMGTVELRSDLPVAWQLTQLQFYSFVDGAELFLRDQPFGSPSWSSASSAGAGVRLGWLSYLNADLTVARALGGPRDDTRFFFALTGKY